MKYVIWAGAIMMDVWDEREQDDPPQYAGRETQ